VTVVDLAPEAGQDRERERTGTAYPDSANADLLSRIPLDARTILDVGCGTGALGAAYRGQNSAARLLGIERDPEMAAIARQRLDAVACVDVQQDPLPFELPDGIDCLIYGDVLQQLRDPWTVLRRQLEALNPSGSVLVCIANVEHWSMVARLLRGNWHYEPAGLFDVRHLRWFSLRNVMRELADAGLAVEEVHPRIFAPEQAQQFVQTFAPGLRRLGIDPGGYLPRAMPLQYVLRACHAVQLAEKPRLSKNSDPAEASAIEELALRNSEARGPVPTEASPLANLTGDVKRESNRSGTALSAPTGRPIQAHHTPRVACIMMQRDESYLIRPWISYHGYLFGFDNLFIFDNGSENAGVRATLAEFEEKGVHVNWSRSEPEDYKRKGEIIGNKIKEIDTNDKYDFVMPLDCDEFVVLKTESNYSCSREAVLAYLRSLVGETRVLRFPYHLANHPAEPDIYHYFSFFKVFFPAGTFESMDHGHHLGKSRKSEGDINTRLVHLHFHHRPLGLLLEQAKRKLDGKVDYNDPTKLSEYSGPSKHLVQYFLMNAGEYYAQFEEMVHFYLPEFRSLLNDLQAPLHLPKDLEFVGRPIVPDGLVANTRLGDGVPVLVPKPNVSGSVNFEFQLFDESAYFSANPELAKAGVEPTAHFCTHGAKEGRPIRPLAEASASDLPSAHGRPVPNPAQGVTGVRAQQRSADELDLRDLLMNFESLGDNCEFGLVQRQAGAEPLGLLRFASPYVPIEVRLRTVVDALARRFEGLGSLDTVHLKLQGKPDHREFLVHESAYQLMHHTFVHEGEVDPEAFRHKEARRLTFLRDKLMTDLAAGEKLWVWKSNLPLSYDDIRPLLDILRRLGTNTLLWVVVADKDHPPGTVERIESDLLKGYIDRFAPYDDATNISFESWYAVSRSAYALWHHSESCNEVMATNAVADSEQASTSPGRRRTPIVSKYTQFVSRSLLSMTETTKLKDLRDKPFSRAALAPADVIDMPPCLIMNPPSAPLPMSDTPHNRIFPRQMRCPEMWVARLDHVYYLPYAAPFLPDPGILLNDFLVPWGPDAIGWFKYEGHSTYRLPIDLNEAYRVDTAFFMGHPISGDSGHFIGDCLSRMHAWQTCRELFGDVKIILDHTSHDTRFRNFLLMAAGVRAEDIILAQGGVYCRRLLLASNALGVSRYASPTSAKLWQQIGGALADPPKDGDERVYFSRSAQSTRKLTNEPEVENLFRSFGFRIVRPEELPIEEQISMASNAYYIAGPIGSAMFNLAFQKRLKSALILVPETFVQNTESLFLAGTSCPIYYHFGRGDMPAGAQKSVSDAWQVDVPQLASEVADWLWRT